MQSQSPHQLLARFGGSHRLLAGYLVEEVMDHLPEAVVVFLTRTALPDRFCAPLGDALLAGSPWANTSQTAIAHLEAQNLFVIPLDDEGTWFRYHDLFRDFLRMHFIRLHRLKVEQGQAGLADLHRRAGDWLAREGQIEDALRHLLAAGEQARAADLLEANLQAMLNRQVPAPVLARWLDLFPEPSIQAHPGLLFAQAYLLLFRWDLAAMMASLDRAEPLIQASRDAQVATSTPSPAPQPTISPLPAPAAFPRTPQPGAVGVWLKGWPDWKPIRYVPAGPFYMGSPQGLGGENERPLHVVTLGGFWIDETEVTHSDYQHCVEAGACDAREISGYDSLGKWDAPIEVTWDVAQAYCRWGGGRLPTEAEWEKAARGSDARTYPWGDEPPDCSRANYESLQGYCFDGVDLVGSFPAGNSPYGVLDLAGNVAEWVNDRYDPGYYARSPGQNPPGPDSGQGRVVRGGSRYDTYPYIRAAYRDAREPDNAIAGVRCVVPASTFRIVASELYDGWYRYSNLDYGFSFHYPPEWRLEDLPHLVILRHQADERLRLAIDYRRAGEDVGHWRTGMPAGEFVARGSVSCLGLEISRDVLVYEGKTKMALYNYSSALPWGEIVLGPVLEVWGEEAGYEAVDLPQDVQNQIDQVVASFQVQEQKTPIGGLGCKHR